MVQAAANAGLDFAAASPRDRHWWLKLRWVLDRTEDLSSQQVFEMQHAQHVGVIDHRMDKAAFDHHWSGANKLLRDTYKLCFPWVREAEAPKDTRNKDVDALMNVWKQKYGDINDPKVRARFKSIAEAMRKRALEGQKGNFSESRTLSQQLKQVAEIRKLQARNKRRGR